MSRASVADSSSRSSADSLWLREIRFQQVHFLFLYDLLISLEVFDRLRLRWLDRKRANSLSSSYYTGIKELFH